MFFSLDGLADVLEVFKALRVGCFLGLGDGAVAEPGVEFLDGFAGRMR